MRPLLAVTLMSVSVATATDSRAQESAEELAKKLSNPVSSLISVPFQNNADFGLGPDDDGLQNTLNIQPVIPISLNAQWNLILRTIMPLVYQDHDVIPGAGSEFGLGDILQSFFFSPVENLPGDVIFGAGPAFLYDTASDDRLGSDQGAQGRPSSRSSRRVAGPTACSPTTSGASPATRTGST